MVSIRSFANRSSACQVARSKAIRVEWLRGDARPSLSARTLFRRCRLGAAFAARLCSLGRFSAASLYAASERVHEVHHIGWPRRGLLLRRREPRLLGADELDHRVLVAVFELLRLELARHLVDDGLG